MTDEFYRIQRLPPYVFAEVNAMKAAARARGEDIVDLGMHGGVTPGYPASHGCIRLPMAFAKQLYTLTKPGDKVVIEG